MPVNPNIIGPSTLAITQAITAFNTFLPSLSEVGKRDLTDTAFVQDVRVGEIGAVSLTIGVGALVSYMTGSSVPTLISAAIAAGMILLYESVLRIPGRTNDA